MDLFELNFLVVLEHLYLPDMNEFNIKIILLKLYYRLEKYKH